MELTKDDKYAKSIFDKAQIVRQQEELELDKRLTAEMQNKFFENLQRRLENLVKAVLAIQQNPASTPKMIDEAQRGVASILELAVVLTDPAVIKQLEMDIQKKRYVEKMTT